MSRTVKAEAEADFTSEDIVRFLLEETSTFDPPTNAEKIARYLQLEIRGFFHQEYNLDPKIRAYLWPARREIGIARMLSQHRKKFSILHEVGHFVIPGHLNNLAQDEKLLDDDRSLSDNSVVKMEMDANRFAANCMFQLDRFQADVDKVELSWRKISRLAGRYDASIIATARRWVEDSLATCALVVFVPITLGDKKRLRYSYTIASESFRSRYFARLTGLTLPEGSTAFRAFRDTSGDAGLVQRLSVDIDDRPYDFDMMLFSTLYNVYGLIVP
ncbi:MAG: ImmA/IrrE family metallo-endopeptidase [Chloroflexi bacterium]|nr:ImmA/IrrE family metallo-endopeptidase [Chloroflexota bacterium]